MHLFIAVGELFFPKGHILPELPNSQKISYCTQTQTITFKFIFLILKPIYGSVYSCLTNEVVSNAIFYTVSDMQLYFWGQDF